MNMFKPVKAKTIEEYIAQLNPERKEVILFIHDFIRKNAPSLSPHFAANMLGYGSFRYRNYKKEIIDWPVVSLASQKNYVSIYVCAVADGQYLAEKYRDKLGTVDVGKSCIRFRKISDLNLETLADVIRTAEKIPGFGSLA